MFHYFKRSTYLISLRLAVLSHSKKNCTANFLWALHRTTGTGRAWTVTADFRIFEASLTCTQNQLSKKCARKLANYHSLVPMCPLSIPGHRSIASRSSLYP